MKTRSQITIPGTINGDSLDVKRRTRQVLIILHFQVAKPLRLRGCEWDVIFILCLWRDVVYDNIDSVPWIALFQVD